MFSKKTSFPLIRNIYLYLICAITMVIMIISLIGMIKIVLEQYVFDVKDYMYYEKPYECSEEYLFYETKIGTTERVLKSGVNMENKDAMIAECTEKFNTRNKEMDNNNVKRELVNYIAMLIVAIPLFAFHWRIVRKEA